VNEHYEVGQGMVSLRRGAPFYAAGEEGHAWRLVSGTLRLDHDDDTGPRFAGLAMSGDVVGAETLLFGRYTFSAHALSPCTLKPWTQAADAAASGFWLQTVAAAERRMGALLALRCGKATERIRKLLALMSGGGCAVVLPRLRDIADITDLTLETVSRTITSMGADGTLDVQGRHRVRWVRDVTE